MASKPIQTWQTKLSTALRRDPKKTVVLASLALVLAVVGGRQLLGQKTTPAPVTGAVIKPVELRPDADAALKATVRKSSAVALQRWLAAPTAPITRNLFEVHLDNYPHLLPKKADASHNGADDKSVVQDADYMKQWQARSEALQLQARELKLESTLMGPVPKAMINGEVVKDGDFLASGRGAEGQSFRVLKIEPRRVILEREGIKLELLMR
jgi:hypothetical protein